MKVRLLPVLLMFVACGYPRIEASPELDAGGGADAGIGSSDAGSIDAGADDAGADDAGSDDAGALDAGVLDAGVLDAGVLDAGVADAGVADAGVADAGVADAGVTDAGVTDAGTADAGPVCTWLDGGALVLLATAGDAGEYALTLRARSSSTTRWSTANNEAVLLEIHRDGGMVGHLALHQGRVLFDYGMTTGPLAAGERILGRVSPLTASTATELACVTGAALAHESSLGSLAEGLRRAPIFKWPVQKRFDDIPLMLGWSAIRDAYEAVFSNENGGTVENCGGGADGMEAEIARWGRGFDVEKVFSYGGASPTWKRCTGDVAFTSTQPRMEALHPIFYYGDGHNRLFESRGGYGATCGSGGAEKSDGDLTGWGNASNPGNAAAQDAPFVVTYRPLPVSLDTLGYAQFAGRREALADAYAPWIYRLTDSENRREGRVDNVKTLGMDRYLWMDLRVADVDGSGDRECATNVSGGFVQRVQLDGGVQVDGPQMTASYFGGADGWKRIAIPLDRAYSAGEVARFVFDAYDDDGMYLVEVGDAFMARSFGDNGATLLHVRQGTKNLDVYVDDDNSGCQNGRNDGGPGGLYRPCVGSAYTYSP